MSITACTEDWEIERYMRLLAEIADAQPQKDQDVRTTSGELASRLSEHLAYFIDVMVIL